MQTTGPNRILLFWLLAAIGLILAPARTLASCDMRAGKTSSRHDCCVRKSACECPPPARGIRVGAVLPTVIASGCACEFQPEPGSPESKTEPLHVFAAAALLERGHSVLPEIARAVPISYTILPPDCIRFSLPPPSRAPPFCLPGR